MSLAVKQISRPLRQTLRLFLILLLVLRDRYIAYRAAAGRPVSRKEFVDAIRYTKAMRGYGPKVATAIAARARRHLKESGN
jgi:RNase P/RNase MRP subunit POP5